nr:hypothetical protein HmN_000335300 [Hymenolepis microstoma]
MACLRTADSHLQAFYCIIFLQLISDFDQSLRTFIETAIKRAVIKAVCHCSRVVPYGFEEFLRKIGNGEPCDPSEGDVAERTCGFGDLINAILTLTGCGHHDHGGGHSKKGDEKEEEEEVDE